MIDEPEIDGILLSHAHADHVSDIHLLHEKIPICMSNELKIILKVLKNRNKQFAEILNIKKSFHHVPKIGERLKELKGKDAKLPRDIGC
ncbi:MAG: hypothetical protein LBC39_05380 [Methanobrevibacter sp.]|jgi:ribonuclease J|nr:hypothetical protein [Candidatus Methanovirga aequatorialis]